ncbi:rhomboid family intramembrane serine protease, partial [Micrococcus sp. HSID17227]
MRHALYVIDLREVDWRERARGFGAAAGGAPVTYGLMALCCAVFLMSPLSGFNPVYGDADALLAAQAGYFERWGVIPSELLDGSAHAALTPLTALFVH